MKKTKTYYATYYTNTHSYPAKVYEYTNKREAILGIRKAAKAETFYGGYANVRVWTWGKDPNNPEIVYEARVHNPRY